MCEETEASWPVPGVVLGYQSNGFSFCFLLRLRDQLRGKEGRPTKAADEGRGNDQTLC